MYYTRRAQRRKNEQTREKDLVTSVRFKALQRMSLLTILLALDNPFLRISIRLLAPVLPLQLSIVAASVSIPKHRLIRTPRIDDRINISPLPPRNNLYVPPPHMAFPVEALRLDLLQGSIDRKQECLDTRENTVQPTRIYRMKI